MKALKNIVSVLLLMVSFSVINAQGYKLNNKNLMTKSSSQVAKVEAKPLYAKVAIEPKEESKIVYTTSQAISLYKQGDYATAIPALSHIVESNGSEVFAIYYLALSYYKTKALDESAETFEKLLLTDRTFNVAYLYLSKIAFEKNENSKALMNANEYIRQNPHSHEGLHLKGLILESQNKLKDALLAFDSAIKINKNESQYHLDMAKLRLKLKSISKACEDINLACKLGNEEAKILQQEYCLVKK
jgi:superkiller protein 3